MNLWKRIAYSCVVVVLVASITIFALATLGLLKSSWNPDAQSWTAFWTFLLVVGAVTTALYAARQFGVSADAAKQTALAYEREIRPYVQVQLELVAMPGGDPRNAISDTVAFVVISSTGKTPARNVILKNEGEFQSSNVGATEASPEHLAYLNKLFSGEYVISMLTSGNALKYVLDFPREVWKEGSGLPEKYSVYASYWDADLKNEFHEEFILDLSPWRWSIAETDPLTDLAKQVRQISKNLEDAVRKYKFESPL